LGLYSKWIFPWLCERALDQPLFAKHRREQLAGVHGEVLEIGIGTGLNLPQYPPAVRKITAIEPNPGMHRRLQARSQRSGVDVDLRPIHGEGLELEDHRFDFVVSTVTLCSIAGVERALAEVFRVLKPSGEFVFLEHGLSPDPNVCKWQRRLNPLQRLVGDGCRLDLDIRRLIASQPFSSSDIDNFYLEQTPRTHGYMYRGTATK